MKKVSKLICVCAALALAAGIAAACSGNERDPRSKNSTPVNVTVSVTPTSISFEDAAADPYAVLEVGLDGTNWQDELTISGLTPNTRYTAYARYKDNEKYIAGDPYVKEVTTPKYGKETPDVSFTQADKTVTFTKNAALEYSYDGGQTYISANTFTFVENGEKTVKVRYKETADTYQSEEQTIKVFISDFYGGFGTEDDPFLLADWQHFRALESHSGTRYYKLVNDITFPAEPLTQIVNLYKDVFDGNGYKFINPKVSITASNESPTEEQGGVFSAIGTVKNLTVVNAQVAYTPGDTPSPYYVGIIAGRAQIVDTCRAVGTIAVTDSFTARPASYIGGLVGRMRSGLTGREGFYMENSFADVTINYASAANTNLTLNVGGLLGCDESSAAKPFRISRCEAKTEIELLGTYSADVGGLAGSLVGDIENSCVTGTITTGGARGNVTIGGIAAKSSNGNLFSCYAAMNIGANGSQQNVIVGGLAATLGATAAKTVENCFYAGNIAITAGTGKTAMADSLTAMLPPTYTAKNCFHSDNLASPVGISKTTAVPEATMRTAAWQRDTLKMNAEIWDFTDDEFPALK